MSDTESGSPGGQSRNAPIELPPDVGTVRYHYTGQFTAFEDLDTWWRERAAQWADSDVEPLTLPVDFVVARWADQHRANPAIDHWLFRWLEVEADRLLYHYTSAEHLLDIAQSSALRMSALTSMRDPREFRDWSLSGFIVRDSGVDIDALHTDARRLRQGTKIVCFGQDRPPPDPRPPLDETMNPHAGKGFLRPRMWEQYGAAHTGVCLIFDRQAIDATFAAHLSTLSEDPVLGHPHPFKGAVSYDDDHDHRLRAGQLGLIDQHYSLREWVTDPDWIREAFLTKDIDWFSEHEYRWGLMASAPGSLDVPLRPKCLLGMVLGMEWRSSWTPVAELFARQFAVPANVARVIWEGQSMGYTMVDFPSN